MAKEKIKEQQSDEVDSNNMSQISDDPVTTTPYTVLPTSGDQDTPVRKLAAIIGRDENQSPRRSQSHSPHEEN